VLATRREALGLLGGGLVASLAGCCGLRGFSQGTIGEAGRAGVEVPFLRPGGIDGISKRAAERVFCVDAHAHFFNASDVTVKGFLEGPVAHTAGGVLEGLLKLLAPLAEALAEMAPTAAKEYDELSRLSSMLQSRPPSEWRGVLDAEIAAHRLLQSERFFDLLQTPRGRPFAVEYQRLQAQRLREGRRPATGELDRLALVRAMALGATPRGVLERRVELPGEGGIYEAGVLAFVGYMLAPRWANVRSYAMAFSEHEESLGVDRVLGSLVDFDRWLDCPPRSSHEDQLRLHARMSRLSGGYMLPLVGYNPWTDIVEDGRSLKLVIDAVKHHGYVGVKIYPANGFRPWGNTGAQDGFGLPSHRDINGRLEVFWKTCFDLDVPVLAHANRTMGADNAHDVLGGPEGWEALLTAYEKVGAAPRVNLGHFGGDTQMDAGDWTERMAGVMARPNGTRVFGDLGYWSELDCVLVGPARCRAAVERLKRLLGRPVGGVESVGDRVMFGTDWLMLSREPHWADYAAEVFKAIAVHAPEHAARIFGANALRCFSKLSRA
jgi:hypothetical protein